MASDKIDYKKLYYSTDTIINKFKPSLSNYFDVFVKKTVNVNGKSLNTDENNLINFLAYEAVLPGTSYETTEVFGDRQGITQTYANKRVYPPVDVSFYVDYDYDVLRFFESWLGSISPNKGKDGSTDSYVKFNYPSTYKTEVIITKFERNFRTGKNRFERAGVTNYPENRCTYTLKNAYPVNLISVPVSYDQANLLRTTVTFNYDVYSFTQYDGFEINRPSGDGSATQGPGGDESPVGQVTRLPVEPFVP
jgi:hypothetical protein